MDSVAAGAPPLRRAGAAIPEPEPRAARGGGGGGGRCPPCSQRLLGAGAPGPRGSDVILPAHLSPKCGRPGPEALRAGSVHPTSLFSPITLLPHPSSLPTGHLPIPSGVLFFQVPSERPQSQEGP